MTWTHLSAKCATASQPPGSRIFGAIFLPPSTVSARKGSSSSLRLQVLSEILEVRVDSAAVLRVFGFQFRHFMAPPGAGPASHQVILRLSGRSPALSVNGL